MTDIYYVYWYKLETYTNPYIEGYIGITNNMKRRDLEHKRNAKNQKFTHFYNAMNKYGISNVRYEVLHTCTKEEALLLEYAYRSCNNIGWNSATGGEDTLGSLTTPITLFHQSDCTKLYKFNSITQASKELKLSEERLRQAKYRGKTIYGYDGWAVLCNDTDNPADTITVQQAISFRLSGIKRSKPSHFKGKPRWSDEDKKRISKQHKGKMISEEQKKIVSNKNKLNHSSCKPISLIHKDNLEKVYTFHSISEAARQLNLPLSRLKSKALRPLNAFGNDGWAIINLGSE